MSSTGLIWDLLAKDQASPTFLRVAGAADKAAASTAKAQKGVQNWSAASAKAGSVLTKAATAPILGLAGVAVDQAAKYQKSMALIQTAGGETAAKTAVISKGLMGIADTTGESLGQLSEGIYTIAKAGATKWSATDQLIMMKAAAQGAVAENVDLGTATDALSTIMFDYGAKAKDAVRYEDMLIRGSGLAKTSMSEYAGSLSNVLPIAASVGLSFQEVGGAIATMTQHGESAQQSTQNLNNLITNLAGQNNVATQAMQQLGINTVDLAQNLGKRGLSGSLAIVDQALKTHTKDGMLVVDVHKSAALATQSLNEELGAMSGALKTQSQGLLSGKTGIKDYTSFAKSMGGQNGAMALQFLALYKSSLGFSNQLKAGKGTITTTTAALNKMLGGMTGANVAMMIGGQYAKQNAANVKGVGDAYAAAGTDVLGWKTTSSTAIVQWKMAQSSLQTMAVQIGDALLPALSKLAGWGASAAKAFNGLSGTDKNVAIWGAGILAAIGPVLSMGSKLGTAAAAVGTFATNMTLRMSTLAGASDATALKLAYAAPAITSAIAGIGIGLAAGSFARNASTGVKWLSALGSAAAGAYIGFRVGGPWGAAIGGAAGGLSALATAFTGTGKAAQNSISGISAYTQAIEDDTTAASNNLRSLTATDLAKTGAFDLGKKFGLDPRTLTDAALGMQAAMQKVKSVLGDPKNLLNPNAIVLGSDVGLEQGVIGKAKTQANEYNAAMSTAGKNDTARKKALDAIIVAQKGATASLKALDTQIAVHGISLDSTTADGKSNVTMLDGLIGKYRGIEQAQILAGVSTKTAAAGFNTSTAALRAQAVQAGLSGQAVDGLIRQYQLTPKQIVTYLLANIGHATASASELQTIINSIRQNKIPGLTANSAQGKAAISELQNRINALNGKNVVLGVGTADSMARIVALQNALNGLHNKSITVTEYSATVGHGRAAAGNATGGLITGPGTGTSDSILRRVSNGEFVVRASATKNNLALLQAINSGVPGFASGGLVGLNKQKAALTAKGSAAAAQIIIGQRIDTGDLIRVHMALTQTTDDLRTALSSLYMDLVKVGAKASTMKQISSLGSKLISEQQTYLSAKDYATSISSTLTGTFQAGDYGSVTDLISGLSGQTSQNNAYTSELLGLRKKARGNKTLMAFINQLATQGQTATLETLAGASTSDLASVTKSLQGYNASVQHGVNAASIDKFGATIAQLAAAMDRQSAVISTESSAVAQVALAVAQHSLKADKNTEAAIAAAMRELTAAIARGRKK